MPNTKHNVFLRSVTVVALLLALVPIGVIGSGVTQAIIPQLVPTTSKQGNGLKFQLATGSTPANNDCAKFDANGNIVTAGGACGVSGGSVTNTGALGAGTIILGNTGVDVTSSALTVDGSSNLSSPGGADFGVGSILSAIVGYRDAVSGFYAYLTPTTLTANRTLIMPDVAGTLATRSGAFAANDCVKYSSGNFVTSGASCGGGGGGSGALVLIEQHTASASASLDFTACISSTYDEYQLEVVSLVPASATSIIMLFSTNGGSSYDAGPNYSWASYRNSTAGQAIAGGGTQSNFDLTMGGSVSTSSTLGGFVSTTKIYSPLNGSFHPRMKAESTANDGTAQPDVTGHMGGSYLSVTAVNAFQIKAGTGNLTSGIVRCYGIEK